MLCVIEICTLTPQKCQNKSENVTLEEKQVLNYLKNDGKLTQKQLAELIGKSDRTIKRIMSTL